MDAAVNPVTNLPDLDDFDELSDVLAEAGRQRPSFVAAYEDAATRQQLLAQLVKIRKALKISQRQVAERMQTTQSAVSDLENGIVDPHLSTLQRYARAITVRLLVGIDMPHDSPWCDARFYARSPDATRINRTRPPTLPSSSASRWRSSTPAVPTAHLEASKTRLVGAQ